MIWKDNADTDDDETEESAWQFRLYQMIQMNDLI